MRLLRFLSVAVLLLMVGHEALSVPKDARKIKQEQRDAKRIINENKKKLATNKKEVNSQMRQLRSLEKEIGAKNVEIDRLQSQVTYLDNGIASTALDIDSLTSELARLRNDYTVALRKVQSLSVARGPLAFLFSAASMNDFFTRLRHIKEFDRWRRQRESEIKNASDELSERRKELTEMKATQHSAIARLNENKALLMTRQSETDRLVDKLRKEGGRMQQVIDQKQKQLAALDRELNRIIEADRKARAAKAKKQQPVKSKKSTPATKPSKPSVKKTEPVEQNADFDRELSGSFESNRGRLLFPVSGRYRVVRGFGNGQYSSRVQTSHLGIDIEVPRGTSVRAIFDGVVTNISHLDGFNTIAVIRHGNYLSVYVNLASVTVRAGQKISKGQVFGTVAADDDGVNGLLQFGIRKERQELNPLQWVR